MVLDAIRRAVLCVVEVIDESMDVIEQLVVLGILLAVAPRHD